MSETVDNAVRIVGDFGVLPGASQILAGNYASGLIHAAVGIASKAFLGPIGPVVWVATAANSYSMAVNGKSLLHYGQAAVPAATGTGASTAETPKPATEATTT